jgi:hypothetical protein
VRPSPDQASGHGGNARDDAWQDRYTSLSLPPSSGPGELSDPSRPGSSEDHEPASGGARGPASGHFSGEGGPGGVGPAEDLDGFEDFFPSASEERRELEWVVPKGVGQSANCPSSDESPCTPARVSPPHRAGWSVGINKPPRTINGLKWKTV